ncbi:rare lipoprotein A [Roseibium sp. TrichSKD4]|nr:rare lipoprotein A [Roseibium sp. TrichSKD4]
MSGLGVFSTFALQQTSKATGSKTRTGQKCLFRICGRTVAVAVIAGLVAACGSTPESPKAKFSPKKYGVKGSPKMVAKGEPVPKGGGRYVVGKKYKIAGKWYYPKHDPDYKNVGLASWYGPTFHGRKTANGEVFDRYGLTAAHTTMPLPSYARVTNVKNGRSMIVRVNDRGPFHGNRIIDLSERVADMLGTKQGGVAKVKVEYVGKARLDGLDEKYLMASYNGPDAVAPGGTFPGTQLAQAVPPQLLFGDAPPPAPRPYMTASASIAQSVDAPESYRLAFDPAAAFAVRSDTVKIASSNAFTPKEPTDLTTGFSEPVDLPSPENSVQNEGFQGIDAEVYGSALSSYSVRKRIHVAHDVFDFARSDSVALADLAQR